MIENENSIYIKYRVDGINYTEKIVSLNTKDTLSINEDTEFPMMIFCFGNKSVLDGIEKFYMFDQIVETYRIKFFVDEYNYTYMYIHIDELVPVKYEMYAHKKKDNSVKHKIVVQLEKASGQYINGLANMISLDKDATATAFVK